MDISALFTEAKNEVALLASRRPGRWQGYYPVFDLLYLTKHWNVGAITKWLVEKQDELNEEDLRPLRYSLYRRKAELDHMDEAERAQLTIHLAEQVA